MAPISLKKGYIDVLAGDLVKHYLQVEEGDVDLKIGIEYVMSNLRFHRFLDVNPLEVSRSLDGISYIFRVNSQDEKADVLESLVSRYMNLPLLDDLNCSRNVQTDAHYALLSFLLESANNPLKSVLPSKSKTNKEVESIDWKKYLVSDAEPLGIGVSMSEECERRLNDSDDEVWNLTDDEFEFSYDFDDSEEVSIAAVTEKQRKTEHVLGYTECSNASWMHANAAPSYWLDDDSLNFRIGSEKYGVAYDEICRNWEIFKGTIYNNSHLSYKLLTEKQLVIETIWMLQGIENLYVYQYEKGKYFPNENIVVTHLTRETLISLLTSFVDIGNKVNELKNYSEKVLNCVDNVSKTFKTFAYVVGRYLMKRLVLLSRMEQTITDKEATITLLVLKRWLMDDSSTVTCIYQLYLDSVVTGHKLYSTVTERVVYFMDIFYTRVCTYDHLGDAGLDKILLILPMFLVVCQPYLGNLDNWMTMGKLPDPGDEEFMIYKARDIEKGEANYWSQTFKIKEVKVKGRKSTTLVPKFVQGVQKQILLAGKSLGLLAEFGNYITNVSTANSIHDEFKENLKKYLNEANERFLKGKDLDIGEYVADGPLTCFEDPLIDPLIKENFSLFFLNRYQEIQPERKNRIVGNKSDQLINQFDEWIELLKDGSCRPPIKLLMEKCLFPVILKRYDTSCRFLLQFFIDELNLFHHMQMMWNFFLMEAGGAIHSFFSELFGMAKRKAFWQDVAYLNIVLQDAIQLYHPNMTESLKVGLEPSELRSNAYLFDGLSLQYKVPWPITIILDVKTEQKYNEIFTFLLRVRRAIWVLKQLRFFELLNPLSSTDALIDGNYSDEEEQPLQRTKLTKVDVILESPKQKLKVHLYILRMKMLHVIHSFYFYLVYRIQEATHVEFEPKLKEAKDLDEILEQHYAFLGNVRKKCFLHEKIGRPREAICRILTLVFDFELLWLSGIDVIDTNRLEIMEIDFNRCREFLHAFFTSIAKRSSNTHYEFLAHSFKA